MLYGSETCYLRENEMAILKTEKAMIRANCGVKLIAKRITNGFAGFENFGQTSQSERSAMVRARFLGG